MNTYNITCIQQEINQVNVDSLPIVVMITTIISSCSLLFAGLNWKDFHKKFSTINQNDFHLFELFGCIGVCSLICNITIIYFL